MEISYFDKLLNGNNAIRVTDDFIIFKEDCELYSFKTEQSKQYSNVYELVEDNPKIKKSI